MIKNQIDAIIFSYAYIYMNILIFKYIYSVFINIQFLHANKSANHMTSKAYVMKKCKVIDKKKYHKKYVDLNKLNKKYKDKLRN